MLRDLLIAGIRTGVAAAVGFALTWLVGFGVEVPEDFEASLTVVVFGAVVLLYNVAVGFLERRVHPLFGVLLGVPSAPAYPAVTKSGGDGGHVDLAVVLVSIASAVVVVAVYVLIR